MRKLTAVFLALILALGLFPAQAEQDAEFGGEAAPETGMIVGGWSAAEDPAITEEISNLFFRALDAWQTGTVTYTPVALLGTQLVAGMNYAVLCKAGETNRGTKWVILYVYQDLQGNATVVSEADVVLGI